MHLSCWVRGLVFATVLLGSIFVRFGVCTNLFGLGVCASLFGLGVCASPFELGASTSPFLVSCFEGDVFECLIELDHSI